MRAVVQRVKKASVKVDDKIISSIAAGYVVLLGITLNDNDEDINYIIDKVINLRIFKDENGKMNNSISSIQGELIIVSQFTLYGDVRKGRRPSYSDALCGEKAEEIYNIFIKKIKESYDPDKIQTGIFGAMMEVEIINSGPVTILLDSSRLF